MEMKREMVDQAWVGAERDHVSMSHLFQVMSPPGQSWQNTLQPPPPQSGEEEKCSENKLKMGLCAVLCLVSENRQDAA